MMIHSADRPGFTSGPVENAPASSPSGGTLAPSVLSIFDLLLSQHIQSTSASSDSKASVDVNATQATQPKTIVTDHRPLKSRLSLLNDSPAISPVLHQMLMASGHQSQAVDGIHASKNVAEPRATDLQADNASAKMTFPGSISTRLQAFRSSTSPASTSSTRFPIGDGQPASERTPLQQIPSSTTSDRQPSFNPSHSVTSPQTNDSVNGSSPVSDAVPAGKNMTVDANLMLAQHVTHAVPDQTVQLVSNTDSPGISVKSKAATLIMPTAWNVQVAPTSAASNRSHETKVQTVSAATSKKLDTKPDLASPLPTNNSPAIGKPTAASAPTPNLTEQLTSTIKDTLSEISADADSQGPTTVNIRLESPEIGTVHLQISVSQDVVSVRISTGDEMARQLVQGQISQLQQSLTQGGIQCGQFLVDCDESRQQSPRRNPPVQPTLAPRIARVRPATTQSIHVPSSHRVDFVA